MKRIFFVLAVFVVISSGCAKPQSEDKAKVKDRVVLDYISSPSTSARPQAGRKLKNNDNIMYDKAILETNYGNIVVEFYQDEAPQTVKNFQKLAAEGFYNDVKFHRVIKDFMIQAGDPLSKDDAKKDFWGTGGPGYKFPDEINNHKLVKGSVAMANSGPDTNGSQFFIVTAPATPWLDGKHTNFGFVVEGMDVVEKISQVETDERDRPVQPVIIEGIELE